MAHQSSRPASVPVGAAPSARLQAVGSRWRRSHAVFVYLIAFFDALGFGLILPLIPFAMTAAGASPKQITLHLVAFAAGSLLAGPVVGSSGDRFGHAFVIRATILIGLGSFVGMWLAPTWEVFLLFRLMQGVGAAKDAVLTAFLMENAEEASKPQALATMGAWRLLGMFLGPAVGGGVAAAFGGAKGGIELVLLLSAAVALAAFAFSLILREPHHDAAFTRRAEVPRAPLRRRIVRLSRAMVRPLAWNMGVGAAMGVVFSVTVLFINSAFRLGPGPIGAILAVVAVTVALSRMLLVKAIMVRFGMAKAVLALSILLSAAMAGIGAAPNFVLFMISLLAGALAMGVLPVLLNMIFERAGPAGEKGLVFGLFTASFTVGQMLSAAVSGLLFEKIAIAAPFYLASLAMLLCVLDQALIRVGGSVRTIAGLDGASATRDDLVGKPQ